MRVRSAGDLAAIVKGRRKDLAISQAELAHRAGVARKSISELESGKTQPELNLALRVLEQLGLVIEVARDTDARTRKRAIDLDAVIEEHRRK
jgi:DNA-binding XRE family transcriptional regulator